MSSVVLGVDGGTSKTKALLALPDGTIVGSARTGGSNIYEGDPQLGLANAMQAPEDAIIAAGVIHEAITTSVFSMSGADWPEDKLMFRAAARARGLGRDIEVVNDALGGLQAAFPGELAVAIICGTHAACAARGRAGAIWHNSFWQLVGGGHDLGSAGLRAVYRADLGIVPPTALTKAILAHFDMPTVEDLLHRQTALFADPFPNLALLAPTVLATATAGDAVALELVTRQARDLSDNALAAARKVGILNEPFDLVLGGGVFREGAAVFADAIATAMRESQPDLRVLQSRHEPVVGALAMALERSGITVNTAVRERIIATLPAGWH